jgi:signal transduction histidine kinase
MSAVPLGLPRHSVRMRLMLLYIGLFLASAACLLTITYFLVDQQLPRVTTNGAMIAVSGGGGETSGGVAGSCTSPAGALPVLPGQQAGTCQPLLQAVALRTGQGTLNQLLIESGIALGIMALASVGLGWLMAGRVLSPLRTITAAARRISARNLHQRIAMTGPDDELKELGDTFDQLLARLDASFRAQRQFVANSSHELRTPLARQRTLLEDALLDLTNRGDLVIDPFLGSGSTLIAAEATGCVCRGVELDPLYVDVIMRRYEATTGEPAVLLVTGETFETLAERRRQETEPA